MSTKPPREGERMIMKGYPLALPDDPDLRALFDTIYVTNTGDLLIRFAEVTKEGVARRVAVLRELSDAFTGPGFINIPIVMDTGMLRLSFSNEAVMQLSESAARDLFKLAELGAWKRRKPASAARTYKPSLSADEIADLVEILDRALDTGESQTSKPEGERSRLRALRTHLANTDGGGG